MTTKEKIQKEIEKMPDDLLETVFSFIHNIKTKKADFRKIHTFKLSGKFDDMNIRAHAYE
jgi:hypothetical protein